jgi:hypothetical protein
MSSLNKSKAAEPQENKDSSQIKNTLNLGMQESKIINNPAQSEIKSNNGSELKATGDPKRAQTKPGGHTSKSPARATDTAADLIYMQNVVEMLQCLRSNNYAEEDSIADTAMKVNQSI